MLEIALWILVGVAALIGLDQLLLWMEAKGWIYYRKVKSKSSLADVFLGSNVVDPGARYLQETRDERPGEEDEDDGDDNSRRKSGDRVSQIKNAGPAAETDPAS
jgi:hypothetical protein